MEEITLLAENTKIIEIIDIKLAAFIETHRNKPHYIKIPLWAYNILRNEIKSYYGGNIFKYNKYKDCRLCPTISIKHIEEIEVF